MDGRNPAPPKKPWIDGSLENTKQTMVPRGFNLVQELNSSIHSMLAVRRIVAYGAREASSTQLACLKASSSSSHGLSVSSLTLDVRLETPGMDETAWHVSLCVLPKGTIHQDGLHSFYESCALQLNFLCPARALRAGFACTNSTGLLHTQRAATNPTKRRN